MVVHTKIWAWTVDYYCWNWIQWWTDVIRWTLCILCRSICLVYGYNNQTTVSSHKLPLPLCVRVWFLTKTPKIHLKIWVFFSPAIFVDRMSEAIMILIQYACRRYHVWFLCVVDRTCSQYLQRYHLTVH